MDFKYQEMIFDFVFYMSWVLYLITYYGLMYSGLIRRTELIELLDTIMKYYISLFLIIRFNPFYKTKFINFDKKVVFSAGIFLLTTTALGQYAKTFDFTPLAELTKHLNLNIMK